MSCHIIYYKDGAKMMRPVQTREEYLALRNGGQQVNNVKRIRLGETALKPRLVQMNYSCLPNEDGSLKGSTRMSNSVGMDIDHIAAADLEQVRHRILEKADELGLLMMEESARGEGYHLVFKRRPELSQEENLKWASDLLGVEYDKGAKDITRVFFTTTEKEMLYLKDELFENSPLPASPNGEGTVSVDSLKTPVAPRGGTPSEGDDNGQSAPPLGGDRGGLFPTDFKGLPYSEIIAEYWRRTGGEPTEGERNKRLHQLAANLRAICDDSEEWLLELMPRFGLPEQEMKSIVHSACKEPTKGSRLMDQIVDALARNVDENEDECSSLWSGTGGAMVNVQWSMKRFPQGVRESIEAVGPQLAMPIVTAICPCIGMLATGVTLDVHGQKKGLNLISYIAGDFASGKGGIDPVVEAWMSEMVALDKMYQMQEDEWRAKKRAAKNKKEQPEEPKLPVRCLTLNNTVANLAERLANTEGKHAFSFTPEADTVAQKWKSTMSDFSVMLR